jgi:hypothetical protein
VGYTREWVMVSGGHALCWQQDMERRQDGVSWKKKQRPPLLYRWSWHPECVLFSNLEALRRLMGHVERDWALVGSGQMRAGRDRATS